MTIFTRACALTIGFSHLTHAVTVESLLLPVSYSWKPDFHALEVTQPFVPLFV
jgi:hypothetical protein